jgi:hypothetical protein
MTPAATQFIAAMTLQRSGQSVLTDLWASGAANAMGPYRPLAAG